MIGTELIFWIVALFITIIVAPIMIVKVIFPWLEREGREKKK